MEWVVTAKPNHQFVKFIVNDCEDELNWAIKTSILKANNTIDSWQQRTLCKRFTNIFLGDLAKNILKTFLIAENNGLKNAIIEYDEVRIDNFKEKDKFDLRLYKGESYCNFEVKSSGEKYSTDYNKMLERNIIINYENVHQHLECAIIQIMFIPKDLNFFQNENYECNDFNSFVTNYITNFKNADIVAYIVGYANKEMQKQAIQEIYNIENTNANANMRKYGSLKIRNSLPMKDFLKRIIEIFNV